MYEVVLALHSWLRWLAILAGIAATLMAALNRPQLERWGLIFMIALDVQILLGLLLYFGLSPNTAAILRDFGAAMGDRVARFWAVEHITMMLAAAILVHLGRVLGRKARTPASRRTRALVCFGLATVLMLVAIPWPGMANGRPLFRI